MNGYEFLVDTPVNLELTGKFMAPTPEWMHLTRLLLDYELIVMTDGILYIAGDNNQYVVEKGEYLLLAPLTNQYGYRSSNCSFYWLHFSYKGDIHAIDLSSSTHTYQAGKIFIPQQGSLKNIEKIVVMMKQLQDSVRCYRENTLNNYMSTSILCEMYNQLHFFENYPDKKSKQQQIYNDILDYIKWSLHENIKVSQVADYFSYNDKYISHLFARVSGMSLKQYIMLQKMEVAKFILSDTNNSISEIAAQLSYNDCHNFMKVFKRIVGLTPTEYRNAYSKRLLYYK